MTRRTRLKPLLPGIWLGLALLCSSPAAVDAFPLGCFDRAVIATQPRETWMGSIGGENDIIGHSLVRINFAVEESLAGHGNHDSVTVVAAMHAGFNPQIEHFLLLLKRTPNGHYNLVTMDYRIVQDGNGDFVRLVADRADSAGSGGDPIWDDAVNRLAQPVRYNHADAWWLTAYPDQETSGLMEENPLGALRGRTIVAQRGIPVRRLVAALSARRCGRNAQ